MLLSLLAQMIKVWSVMISSACQFRGADFCLMTSTLFWAHQRKISLAALTSRSLEHTFPSERTRSLGLVTVSAPLQKKVALTALTMKIAQLAVLSGALASRLGQVLGMRLE